VNELLEIKLTKPNETVVVTVKVKQFLVDELDKLVEKGYFESRSDAIRYAIIQLLKNIKNQRGINH